MKKGVLILIVIGVLFIIGSLLYLVIRINKINNFRLLYSSIQKECKPIKSEILLHYTIGGKEFTQKFLFGINRTDNINCSLNIKVLEYTDLYGRGEEFENWLVGKESICNFNKEELTIILNEFERYVNLDVFTLDRITTLLRKNCEGAFTLSLGVGVVKRDSGISVSNMDCTLDDDWCFFDV